MKKFDRIVPILLLLMYMGCLLAVGFMMFQNAGRQTNKEISIYKENNTPVTYLEHDSESGQIVEKKSGADIDSSDDIEDTDETEGSALRIVGAVEIKRQWEEETKNEYNGLDLQDNGLPYAIKVNRQENIVTVYELDSEGYYTIPVRVMCCSVSEDDTTPIGLFNTSDRFEWALLIGGVYGQYAYKIYGGILFHSVPYVANSHSQLETWEYNKLGTGASLGCVRLCVADAKWIYVNCPVGTQVNIFDSDYYGPLGKPQPAYILEDDENPGWDPTDMTVGNPYMTEGQIFGASSHTIEVGEPFDAMAGVIAFSSDLEDVTSEVVVEGIVDNQNGGEYPLVYTFDDNGQVVTTSIVITVADHEAPVIRMAPDEIMISGYAGDTGALTELIGEYVTAYDGNTQIETVEDAAAVSSKFWGDALFIDTSGVGTDPGSYKAYAFAIDASGNISDVVKITIHIVD